MSDIGVFGLISMILFFLIFLGVIYWTIRADKKYLKKMENMPLDSSKVNGDKNHG
jgi:cbb3-type cytochrome oxidase subunit 3